MIELELNLPSEKIGWLGLVEENIHPDETFRIHFSGLLHDDDNLSFVSLELPEGIKLRPHSRILRREYENERFIGTIPEIPMWKNVHPDDDYVKVDFDAEVTEIRKDHIVILLPDSYKKEDTHKSSSGKEGLRTFSFKTEHTYLLELIAKVLHEKPIVQFYGPLTSIHPEDSRVEIDIPISMKTETQGGGMVSLSSQGITLAVVNNLPDWEEKAEELGTPGYLFVNFEAVVTHVSNGEITVSLPEFYR